MAILAALACVALVLYLLWLWQPRRQMLLHQRNLMAAAESRNWEKVAKFISDKYEDRWGFDKATAVNSASDVFRQFFAVSIHSEDETASVVGDAGTVFSRVTIEGNGTALAQEAMRRVNTLRKPFRFEWRRVSAMPWDWELTEADQPELRIKAREYFF